MSDRTNRRDEIVQAASTLFVQQGYNATSVRQIADAVGCTEAALYYHFKDGKRALLQAVVECGVPKLLGVIDNCRKAESLRELILLYAHNMAKSSVSRSGPFRWLIAEFPNLSEEERAVFHNKHRAFVGELQGLVARFVADPEEARVITWTMVCTGFGYLQLFVNLDVQSIEDLPPETLFGRLADSLAAGR